MEKIATYVFLDFETTGKESYARNLEKIEITELSLVAVKRKHLLETSKGVPPRVINKITLCLKPSKDIQPSCVRVSGLTNEMLENESPFNNNVLIIMNTFLMMLTQPVCLIAQNGFRWDFPVLKSNLKNFSLFDDLLCTDSLFAFYHIMDVNQNTHHIESPNVFLSAEQETNNVIVIYDSDDDIQTLNEKTPTKSTMAKNKMPQKSTERQCFYSKVKGGFPWKSRPEESYKLKNIYVRLFDEVPSTILHRAENDCIVLLQCATAVGQEFVDWVDGHHSRFHDIPPMSSAVIELFN